MAGLYSATCQIRGNGFRAFGGWHSAATACAGGHRSSHAASVERSMPIDSMTQLFCSLWLQTLQPGLGPQGA
eukprot:352927-Chlamydomonas_euryale.AAC.4